MSDTWNSTRSEVQRSRREPSKRPRAWLFHVFSCDAPMAPIAAACNLDDVDEVTLGRSDPGAATVLDGDHRQLRLGFPDQWMSTRHARIERCVGGFWVADEGSKNGLLLNGDRTDGALLVDGDWIEAGHTLLRYRHGALPPPRPPRGSRSDGVVALLTALPTLEEQSRNLEEIARSGVSVVLRGETGTGKEVVARAVHQLSGRPGELIAVNCGALPATLLESELFGYRKGAFSSAVEDRPGLVRAADRGTLFLDEIGDLPPSSQAALLRVLQEHEVTPLGGTRPVKVDLRVLCATHRDLEAQVALGQFCADLYARLSGHTFSIPPLRERREDLGLLTAALLRRVAPRSRRAVRARRGARAVPVRLAAQCARAGKMSCIGGGAGARRRDRPRAAARCVRRPRCGRRCHPKEDSSGRSTGAAGGGAAHPSWQRQRRCSRAR